LEAVDGFIDVCGTDGAAKEPMPARDGDAWQIRNRQYHEHNGQFYQNLQVENLSVNSPLSVSYG
jgi:hypothetical protein